MEAHHRVNLVQVFGRQTQRRAVSGVFIIPVRNDRIQTIVPAGELNHYEYCVTFTTPGRGSHQ
jgi:hypothetical protein